MARRYRDIALVPPVHAFVDSPIGAAIATGIAVGVRWLQRHPEAHVPLFGYSLDDAALRSAIRDAVTDVCARFEYPPAAAPIEAAIWKVTSTRAAVLPPFARGSAREIELLSGAPELAARDGDVDAKLFEPLARVRDQIIQRLPVDETVPWAEVIDVIGQAIDHEVSLRFRDLDAESFLRRTLAAWWSSRQKLGPRRHTLAFVAFFRRRWAFGIDYRGTRDLERAHAAAAVFAHADFWIAADWGGYAMDDRRRLHRVGGPAVHYRDGTALSFLHGVRVPRAICEGRFDVGDILHATNAEVRRTMIEVYERGDRGRFLRDARADVISIDYDRLGHQRRLLRVLLDGDEPYVGVEVTNSTPEPDGSYKHYILRVPPSTTTCRAAVAWTFGLGEHDYDPEAET